ncbi:MAG: hypothetical protein AVDCRST_MAG66-1176, partial [uncultured Pseudonocardia sp.]
DHLPPRCERADRVDRGRPRPPCPGLRVGVRSHGIRHLSRGRGGSGALPGPHGRERRRRAAGAPCAARHARCRVLAGLPVLRRVRPRSCPRASTDHRCLPRELGRRACRLDVGDDGRGAGAVAARQDIARSTTPL